MKQYFTEDDEPNWPAFYEHISRHGPGALLGLEETEREYFGHEARETDSFWSAAMQDALEGGWSCPWTAVANATTKWLINVRTHVLEELFMIDPERRIELATSLRLDTSGDLLERLMLAATNHQGDADSCGEAV